MPRAFQLLVTTILLPLLLIGCGGNSSTQSSGGDSGESEAVVSSGDEQKANTNTSAEKGSVDSVVEQPVVVTREDLQAELKRHKNDSGWKFGPRENGVPVGTWMSQDANPLPLVFADDGTFQCGFGWASEKREIAKGFYAIAEDGLVVAVASAGSARLGLFYRLEADGNLYGSRGPSPRVAWKRVGDVRKIGDE